MKEEKRTQTNIQNANGQNNKTALGREQRWFAVQDPGDSLLRAAGVDICSVESISCLDETVPPAAQDTA